MRKNCGKLLVKKNIALTKECFNAAVDEAIIKYEVNDEVNTKEDLITDMRSNKTMRTLRHSFGIDAHPKIDEIKEFVDNLYLEKLCTLPTKDIEDIIWIHDNKRVIRAARTIETLTSELVRRALMGDSFQSESKTKKKKPIKKKPTRRKQ